MYRRFVDFVRELYQRDDFIPIHAPQFHGNESKYLMETIDSTMVSSVGGFVNQFEQSVSEYMNAEYAIATVNGTSALHTSLMLVGVEADSEVITQSFTFIATCNAIRYCQATPLFVDIEEQTLGLSPKSLMSFLEEFCEIRDDGFCWNRESGRRISACLPMHTFGFPVSIEKISNICKEYNIPLIEDAAESLGSRYNNKHTGTFGVVSAISFNGNKVITTGGGGMIVTDDDELAKRARHITTTSRVSTQRGFIHDEIGYNYRLPNLNAAMGVAQMEWLPKYLESKRKIANLYQQWGENNGIHFFKEAESALANYWLNAVILENKEQRDEWLEETNARGVMTRPAWKPMHQLEMNQDCRRTDMSVTEYFYQRLVNVPSSAII